MRKTGLALALAVLLAGAARADTWQETFDLSPFTPGGVSGEVIGVTTLYANITHARIDATFECQQQGTWSMFANFAFPTGIAGVSSDVEGWSGTGTFSAVIETDALNGHIQPPEGQPFSTWFLEFGGGAPFTLPGGGVGLGPVDGTFTQLKLTLTLCNCPDGDPHKSWDGMGGATAGVLGDPHLFGIGSLCAGEPAVLKLTHAKPGGIAFLVVGLFPVSQPFKGGLLVPEPMIVLAGLPINGSGEFDLPFLWPAGVPAQLEIWFQYWLKDPAAAFGWAASNGLRAIAPAQ